MPESRECRIRTSPASSSSPSRTLATQSRPAHLSAACGTRNAMAQGAFEARIKPGTRRGRESIAPREVDSTTAANLRLLSLKTACGRGIRTARGPSAACDRSTTAGRPVDLPSPGAEFESFDELALIQILRPHTSVGAGLDRAATIAIVVHCFPSVLMLPSCM